MSGPTWYEDDYFWQAYAPLMFNEDRWADAPREAERAAALLELPPGARVLDSCCGVGRHSIAFATRGYRVTGVDRTAAYLEAARETAAAESLDIEFLQEDTRRFRRADSFEGAVNMFTSFGYFETREEEKTAVRNIHDSLVPGGSFLIDVMGKEVLARDFRENDWFEEKDMIVLAEYRVIDSWSRLQNRWVIIRGEERIDYTFSHALYSAAELSELLVSSGFASVAVYGSLDGIPYDHRAKRLIAVAKKENRS